MTTFPEKGKVQTVDKVPCVNQKHRGLSFGKSGEIIEIPTFPVSFVV